MKNSQKIVKVSLSDQVCTKLRDMISRGDFPIGSRLPSESDLANTFGVSRLTVRMALQKLSAQGLTVTRPGDGTFVKEFDITQYLNEISDVVMKPEMLDGVLEFRLFIEGESTRLAIKRASDEDFDQLETLVETMKSRVYNYDRPEDFSLDDCVELDFQFHATLCKLSGNSLFQLAFIAAKGPIFTYLKAITQNRLRQYHEKHPDQKIVDVEQVLDNNSHGDILRCLRNRDYAGCARIFQNLADYKISSEDVKD